MTRPWGLWSGAALYKEEQWGLNSWQHHDNAAAPVQMPSHPPAATFNTKHGCFHPDNQSWLSTSGLQDTHTHTHKCFQLNWGFELEMVVIAALCVNRTMSSGFTRHMQSHRTAAQTCFHCHVFSPSEGCNCWSMVLNGCIKHRLYKKMDDALSLSPKCAKMKIKMAAAILCFTQSTQ